MLLTGWIVLFIGFWLRCIRFDAHVAWNEIGKLWFIYMKKAIYLFISNLFNYSFLVIQTALDNITINSFYMFNCWFILLEYLLPIDGIWQNRVGVAFVWMTVEHQFGIFVIYIQNIRVCLNVSKRIQPKWATISDFIICRG